MSSRLVVLAAALALVGGCLKVAPGDGLLQCSSSGQKCPDNYFCASDNTCWHNGHTPVTSNDMSVPGDLSVNNLDAASPDLGLTGIVCLDPSDCPGTENPCTYATCPASGDSAGFCSPAPSPAGTLLDDQTEYTGTCKQAVCDGNGGTVVSPAPANVPPVPSGGCYTTSCTGAGGGTPAQTPIMEGQSCLAPASGVCNGKGSCGACSPGALRCSPTASHEVQICSADGSEWIDQATCGTAACIGGTCSGTCDYSTSTMTSLCSGNTPIVCNSDNTTGPGSPCVSSTCVAGVCTGTCVYGAPNTCDATYTKIESCTATGAPQVVTNCTTSTPSTPACLNGVCAACNPTATPVGCCTGSSGYPGTRPCDADGTWGACNDTTAQCGHAPTTCTNGVCSCSAPNPCPTNANCGSAVDTCGVRITCGPASCGTNYLCTANVCVYHAPTTTKVVSTTKCPEVANTTTTVCQ